MTKNFKFNLDDIVYYIGEGKIRQAKICEVRFVSRFEKINSGECGVFNSFKTVSYEVYRLYIKNKLGSEVNVDAKHLYEDGEFCITSWFTVDELYSSPEEALQYLKDTIVLLPENQKDITNINNPF